MEGGILGLDFMREKSPKKWSNLNFLVYKWKKVPDKNIILILVFCQQLKIRFKLTFPLNFNQKNPPKTYNETSVN